MARLPDLIEFSKSAGLRSAHPDLIHFRSQNESLISASPAHIQTRSGVQVDRLLEAVGRPSLRSCAARSRDGRRWCACTRRSRSSTCWKRARDALVVGGTTRSERIAAEGKGINGALDCAQSPAQLNRARRIAGAGGALEMDFLTYGIGAQILRDLKVGKMRLMASPRKMPAWQDGAQVTGYAEKAAKTRDS